MFQKSRVFTVAAIAAGTIGLWGSAAYAYSGPSGDNGGLVNVSHNQTPTQICGNDIPVNGAGIQVPVNRLAVALGLLSTEPTGAAQDSSCKQGSSQWNNTGAAAQPQAARTYSMSGNGWAWNYTGPSGDNGGLVNLSHNQVPLQLCNNHIPVNAGGVQVPLDEIAGSLGILSPGGVQSGQDSSCTQGAGQANNS